MLSASQAVALIEANKKVAIVGLSPKEDRPSYKVGVFLQGRGYQITPVHPQADEILGEKAIKDLSQLAPGQVDWIDLFVNPDRLLPLLPEIKRLQPKLVWCQLGVINDDFNQALAEAKIPLIVDHCPKIELS